MGCSRNDPHSPYGGNLLYKKGRGEKSVSDNSKYIRTSKGGGMDVFWNDPMHGQIV
jgi:hypothetical protein